MHHIIAPRVAGPLRRAGILAFLFGLLGGGVGAVLYENHAIEALDQELRTYHERFAVMTDTQRAQLTERYVRQNFGWVLDCGVPGGGDIGPAATEEVRHGSAE